MRLHLTERNDTGLLNDFDRILNTIFEEPVKTAVHRPAVDILEDDEKYILEAELPGYSADDIDIQIHNDLLTISSKQKEKSQSEDIDADKEAAKLKQRWISRERVKRDFTRSFLVPAKADKESINAVFKDGLLNLEIKKLKDEKPAKVKINIG